ncbi:hypothetical protein E2562_009706 [Oryza meyeriana var. granulata]|uniref:Uncharacterized protein n=1 Tax=Oryza meyeriana var. granulata TaxID=110450 RepID=A0A6G1D0E0_9ORYZ|nr:hypothetical protein E2562_009706 [Oryza meyeriana var. granulata]
MPSLRLRRFVARALRLLDHSRGSTEEKLEGRSYGCLPLPPIFDDLFSQYLGMGWDGMCFVGLSFVRICGAQGGEPGAVLAVAALLVVISAVTIPLCEPSSSSPLSLLTAVRRQGHPRRLVA